MRNLLIMIFLVTVTGLHAQEVNPTHAFYINPGVFFSRIQTTLRVDSKTGENGTLINAEDNLGLDNSLAIPEIYGSVNLSPRWSVDFSWMSLHRGHLTRLSQEIRFRDTVFTVGADIDAYFNTDFYNVALKYSIIHADRYNIGLGLGIRWLTAEGGVEVTSTVDQNYKQVFRIDAPAPLPSVYANAWILPQLQAKYEFKYFGLSVRNTKGSIAENRVSLAYYPLKNIGIGGAYSSVNYEIRELPFEPDFTGKVVYNLSGFSAFASLRF